jgi:tyrocidine synthetase-3
MLTKENIKDIYMLAPMQEAMYFQSLYQREALTYFEQVSFRQRGILNIRYVRESLDQLLMRYDILRAVFVQKTTDRPLQVILRSRAADFFFEDIRNVPDKERYLAEFREKDRLRAFDLAKDLLMRVAVLQSADEEYEIIWSWHHILMDAWCVEIIQNEFREIYNSLLEGRNPSLPAVRPYRDFIGWLGKQDKAGSSSYWKGYLEGYAEPSKIPGGRLSASAGYDTGRKDLFLDETVTRQVRQLAAGLKVTVNTVLQVLWGILLSKYNDTQDVVFGTIVSGRPPALEGVESMIGLFINTIPVRIRFDGDTCLSDLIRQAQKSSVESEPHQYLPLSEVFSGAGLKTDWLDHLFLFQNFPVTTDTGAAADKPAAEESLRLSGTGASQNFYYDLNVFASLGDRLSLTIKFNRNKYEEGFAGRMLDHYHQLLLQAVSNSGQCVRNMTMLSAEEQRTMLGSLEAVRASYDTSYTVKRLFELTCSGNGDDPAVATEARPFSYREINQRANALAWHLQDEYRIGKGDIVGITAGHSELTIIGLLAILKTGAAFLPLDPACPRDRRNYMLGDASVSLVLTESQWLFDWVDYPGALFALDIQLSQLEDREENPVDLASPEDPAYVLYTSGSTGAPKGVIISNRSFSNYLQWANRFYFDDTKGKPFAFFTPLTFDLTLTSLFTTLLRGDTVLAFPEKDPGLLLTEVFSRPGIRAVKLTPSHISLLKHLPLQKTEIAYAIVGGEALTREQVDTLRNLNKAIRIFNEYGPTEATVGCTIKEIADQTGEITIGRPISNVSVYILDRNGHLVPDGLAGEIAVGGEALALGYMGKPELTAEKFANSSFGTGQRLYRTGDVGRWLPNGELEYLGRKDQQLKIRGYRIEAGELTGLLKTYIAQDVFVTVRQDQSNVKYLVAYYTAPTGIDVAAAKKYMAEKVPDYMIPAYFVRLDEFPLTTNGKVDVRRLPDPLSGNRETKVIAPRTTTEEKLAVIWKEVLSRDTISMEDKFFEIGGHSLNAAQLASRIYKQLEIRIELKDIFEKETIAAIAAWIDGSDKVFFEEIELLAKSDSYELSHAQKRLWIVDQLGKGKQAYNIPETYVFANLNRSAFERTFDTLIERHESLRTTFHYCNGEPRQKIAEPRQRIGESREKTGEPSADNFRVSYEDLRQISDRYELAARMAEEELMIPFDLSAGPLLRVRLLQVEEDRYICFFTLHHIISDGWSTTILLDEFFAIYNAYCRGDEHSLRPLRIQYKDFACWQNRNITKESERYWLEKLEGAEGRVSLPYAGKAEDGDDHAGDMHLFEINETLARAVRELAAKHNTTVSNVILSIYFLLLRQVSDQDDICIGMAHANRDHPDVEQLIGFFVNVLVIRMQFSEDMSLGELVRQVTDNTWESFRYSFYPYELLVEKICRDRYSMRNSFVNVTYSFQNFRDISTGIKAGETGDDVESQNGLKSAFYDFGRRNKTAKGDLHLIVAEKNGIISFLFEYDRSVLNRETILQFEKIMTKLLKTATGEIFNHKKKSQYEVI